MTIEELKTELEKIISELTTTGFDKINPGIVEKLDKLTAGAGELGMKEGKHLIENLSSVIKAIREGKSKVESGNLRLTALEFYVKKLAVGGNIEEL